MSGAGILLGSNVQFAYGTTAVTNLDSTPVTFGGNNTLQAYVSREGTTFGTDQTTITPTPITQTRVAGSEIVTARNGTFTLNGFGNWNADDDILGDALGAEIISGRVEQVSPSGTASVRLTINSTTVTSHKFTINYTNAGAGSADLDKITAGAILRLNFTQYKIMTDGSGTTYNFNDTNRIFRDRRVQVTAIDTSAKTITVQVLKDINQDTPENGGNVIKTPTGHFPTTEQTSGVGGFRVVIADTTMGAADTDTNRALTTAAFSISGFTISWKYAHFGPATRTRSWVIKTGSTSGFTDGDNNKYHLITNAFVSSYNVTWNLQSERQSTMTIAGARFATQNNAYVTSSTAVRAAAAQVYGSPVSGGQLVFIENSSGVMTVQDKLAVTELSYTVSAEATPINELNRLDPIAQAIGVGRFQASYSTVDTRDNLAAQLSNDATRRGFTYVSGYKGSLLQKLGDTTASTTSSLQNKLFIMMIPDTRFSVSYDPISANDAIRQRVSLSGDVLNETLAASQRTNINKHTAVADTPVVLSFE